MVWKQDAIKQGQERAIRLRQVLNLINTKNAAELHIAAYTAVTSKMVLDNTVDH